jgi:hypothetical protein
VVRQAVYLTPSGWGVRATARCGHLRVDALQPAGICDQCVPTRVADIGGPPIPARTSKARLVASSSSTPAASAELIRVSTTCGWLTSSVTATPAYDRSVCVSVTASSGSRNVNPRTSATASQDWIARSPAVQDATAPASRLRPPTSSDGDCSVSRHPPRETGDGSPPRPATGDRRTHTPAGSAPAWVPRTGQPSTA